MSCEAIASKKQKVCGQFVFTVGDHPYNLCGFHFHTARKSGVYLADGSYLKLVDDNRMPCEDCGVLLRERWSHKRSCKKTVKENLPNIYRVEYVVPRREEPSSRLQVLPEQ